VVERICRKDKFSPYGVKNDGMIDGEGDENIVQLKCVNCSDR